MPVFTFEIPVFSAKAAGTAVSHGATRLEINRGGSYAVGGLTPTLEEVKAAAAAAAAAAATSRGGHSVPLRVMIRPRGRPSGGRPDFVYTDVELDEMRACIGAFVADGLLRPERGDGFVFGALAMDTKTAASGTEGLRIDVAQCQMLVQAAGPFACVLHRAFDEVVATMRADGGIAAARGCGFVGVLTAGGVGAEGATAHVDTLRELVMGMGEDERMTEEEVQEAQEDDGRKNGKDHKVDFDSFEIIIGGGVRSRNISQLMAVLSSARRPVAFHSSCLAEVGLETVDGQETVRMVELLRGVE